MTVRNYISASPPLFDTGENTRGVPVRRTRHRRGLLEGIALRRAREMRRAPTGAEAILWARLRRKAIKGARFRRQAPLYGFIVDFCCLESKLVIELDGDAHAGRESFDCWRSDKLRARGFRVMRFMNSDVTENLEGVMQAISQALAAPPP